MPNGRPPERPGLASCLRGRRRGCILSAMTRDDSGPAGEISRRAVLGLGASGIAAAAAVCASAESTSAAVGATPRPSKGRRLVSENSRPGDPHWQIRHLGAANAIMGYAGAASVLTGQSFPLFVSTTSPGFRVHAFRLGWYGGDRARQVWQSGPLRGHRQNAPGLTGSTNTVRTAWDPVTEVPTDDWPAGAYLLRLDADIG